MPNKKKPYVTVKDLIAKLEALPEEQKDLPCGGHIGEWDWIDGPMVGVNVEVEEHFRDDVKYVSITWEDY